MRSLFVQMDLIDPVTLGELRNFVASAAALGLDADSELELLEDPNENERGAFGIGARGPGGGAAATGAVEVPRSLLGEMVETLTSIIEGEGDARGDLAEVGRLWDAALWHATGMEMKA